MLARYRSSIAEIFLLAALIGGSAPAFATNTDIGKERRWAQQVVDGLLDGDEVWLLDDLGHEFLGIFTEGGSESKRAVILVHGIGVHPNWPDVIYPLREGLLEQGITTLSIQMPILANEADPREYALLMQEVPGRFGAALDYLEDEGYLQVAIVAHSLGSTMAAYYLSRDLNPLVTGFVAIGMGPGTNVAADIDNAAALGRIGLDLLDLYGSQDLEQVLAGAEDRAAAANNRSGVAFTQVEVSGANHFFQGHEDELKQEVVRWLERHWK